MACMLFCLTLCTAVQLLPHLFLYVQLDGFASDSVRMIGTLRKDAHQPVQILLFSATFNEKVKNYALRVVRDNGKEEANQV